MMFANAFGVKGHSDEAEKPFWISYADLMTAMMVLFGRHGSVIEFCDPTYSACRTR